MLRSHGVICWTGVGKWGSHGVVMRHWMIIRRPHGGIRGTGSGSRGLGLVLVAGLDICSLLECFLDVKIFTPLFIIFNLSSSVAYFIFKF